MAEVITLTFRGMDEALGMLQKLPAEVVSKRGGPVKSALRKGALLIAREAALNVAHATRNLTDDHVTTGLLQRSVIATRGKPPQGQNGERYLVRVKRKNYERNGKKVSTLGTARWLEYGTEKQPAEPWLRPAGAAKAQAAIDTIGRELTRGIDRIVRKLAKGAK
jgi:HK97 gp10 family phage protein